MLDLISNFAISWISIPKYSIFFSNILHIGFFDDVLIIFLKIMLDYFAIQLIYSVFFNILLYFTTYKNFFFCELFDSFYIYYTFYKVLYLIIIPYCFTVYI